MLHIFVEVILPVFVMLATGFGIQRAFRLDMRTLSKLNFYIFIPSLILVKFSESGIGFAQVGRVMLFTASMVASLWLVAWPIAKLRGYGPRLRAAFANSLMFYNSGNYGLPVIEIVYHSPIATGIQSVVMATQNLLTFSFGLIVVANGANTARGWAAILQVLRYPFIYALAAAFVLKGFAIHLPDAVWVPLTLFSDALVPIALVTLGAQLAEVKLTRRLLDVLLASSLRLLGGPAIAPFWLWLYQIHGLTAAVLSISVAVPTAVNTAIMAIELDNEPEFAAQAVFVSTLLSALTMTLVIAFVQRFNAL